MASQSEQGTQQTTPIDKLDSIDDLKKINFGQSVPKHSLLLLHWFANTVKIDDNGIWLTFDPKRQYGSHDYDNHEGLLPQGHQYYTVGDLNHDQHELPAYMFYELRDDVGKNVDRIIFSVNQHGKEKGAGLMIDKVYMTQHKINEHQTTAYDGENTYLVSTSLLRQIGRFSEVGQPQSLWILNTEFGSNADDFQLLDFCETWNFPHLGLLLFTVTQKTQFFQKRNRCRLGAHSATSPSQHTALGFAVSIPESRHNHVDFEGSGIPAKGLQNKSDEIKPEVMTGTDDKNRILWSNIPPRNRCQRAAHTATSPSPSQHTALGFAVSIPESRHNHVDFEGSGIPAKGLQNKSDEIKPEVMTGTDDKNRILWSNIPTSNRCQRAAHTATSPSQHTALGYAVSIPETSHNHVDSESSEIPARGLQDQSDEIKLEVMTGTDGKARIIWSNVPTHPKKQDVMVVLFKNKEDQEASKTYEFIGSRESGSYDTLVPLNEGLQARLHNVKKWCFLWRGVGEEICRGTEFKNPEPVNITGYGASLQLFVKDGKACARLYVKKSFSEWKSEFNESWVGFYTSADKTNEYKWWQWQWQWATKFKPSHDFEDSTYDVYEYNSGMAIAQGVQARFMLRDEVVKACTSSWK